MKKMVIGIDQSYSDTSITIAVNGEVKKIMSIDFKGLQNNTDKRAKVAATINDILLRFINKYDIKVIVERIRLFSHNDFAKDNKKEKKQFISKDVIKSHSALVATIIDTCRYDYGLPVYSVDTRSWKAQILGTAVSKKSKKGVAAKKQTSVDKAIELGYEDEIAYVVKAGPNKGEIRYNDNKADSLCIALYGFLPESRQKLDIEKF